MMDAEAVYEKLGPFTDPAYDQHDLLDIALHPLDDFGDDLADINSISELPSTTIGETLHNGANSYSKLVPVCFESSATPKTPAIASTIKANNAAPSSVETTPIVANQEFCMHISKLYNDMAQQLPSEVQYRAQLTLINKIIQKRDQGLPIEQATMTVQQELLPSLQKAFVKMQEIKQKKLIEFISKTKQLNHEQAIHIAKQLSAQTSNGDMTCCFITDHSFERLDSVQMNTTATTTNNNNTSSTTTTTTSTIKHNTPMIPVSPFTNKDVISHRHTTSSDMNIIDGAGVDSQRLLPRATTAMSEYYNDTLRGSSGSDDDIIIQDGDDDIHDEDDDIDDDSIDEEDDEYRPGSRKRKIGKRKKARMARKKIFGRIA